MVFFLFLKILIIKGLIQTDGNQIKRNKCRCKG